MRVAVYDTNLLWTERLKKTLTSLGHEPLIIRSRPESTPETDVAIVNLSLDSFGIDELVPSLTKSGVYVIGHAGHKEQDAYKAGETAGCNIVVSNGSLTHRLDKILEEVPQR